MRTAYIESGGKRMVISQHPDACFVCTEGGMFLSEDQLTEAIAELRAVRRALRKRG